MMQEEQKKGFRPFYIFPLLYVISIYIYLFSVVEDIGVAQSFAGYLPIVFGIVNIVVSILYCKPQNRILMLNAAVFVKFALIPFFIVGGLAVFMSFFLSFIPVPFMIFVGPMLGLMGIFVGWVILVLESPYVISYLRLSSKAKLRSKGMVILHSILQFFFTVDVFDVMVLAIREGKWKKLILCLCILAVLLVVFLFLFIATGFVGALASA